MRLLTTLSIVAAMIIIGCSSPAQSVVKEYEEPIILTTTPIVEDSSVDWNYWRDMAIKSYDYMGFAKAISNGADCNISDSGAIDDALYYGLYPENCNDLFILKTLLEVCGLDPNYVPRREDNNNRTLLMLGIERPGRCTSTTDYLIESGADVDYSIETTIDEPCNALSLAADLGYYESVVQLVESGADISTICPNNMTPYNYGYDNKDIREYLESKGVDIRTELGVALVSNVWDYLHKIGIHYKEQKFDHLCGFVRELTSNGISINIPGFQGKTALDLASETEPKDEKLVEFLKSIGAKRSNEL
jgi:hypothetical protein